MEYSVSFLGLITELTFLSGPTHVLVVRGLDENADEEMLRYEFSKHAPIKVLNGIGWLDSLLLGSLSMM